MATEPNDPRNPVGGFSESSALCLFCSSLCCRSSAAWESSCESVGPLVVLTSSSATCHGLRNHSICCSAEQHGTWCNYGFCLNIGRLSLAIHCNPMVYQCLSWFIMVYPILFPMKNVASFFWAPLPSWAQVRWTWWPRKHTRPIQKCGENVVTWDPKIDHLGYIIWVFWVYVNTINELDANSVSWKIGHDKKNARRWKMLAEYEGLRFLDKLIPSGTQTWQW
jgi:hypothetical protein